MEKKEANGDDDEDKGNGAESWNGECGENERWDKMKVSEINEINNILEDEWWLKEKSKGKGTDPVTQRQRASLGSSYF